MLYCRTFIRTGVIFRLEFYTTAALEN